MLTIDLQSALLCLLIVAGIVLVVFLIIAVYNLIKTLKQSQKVLNDFETVGAVASKRTKELDKLIDQTQKKMKSGEGILSSVPFIINIVTQIAKAVGKGSGGSSKS